MENIRRGLDLWEGSQKRMLISVALPLAENFIERIRGIEPIERAEIAGSLRRRRETIGDLDVLIQSKDAALALKEITRLPIVKQVLGIGDTKATVIIEGGIQVDVRAVPVESFGAALQYFTGSKQHNIHLRTLAQKAGLKVNEYGVFRGERRLGGKEESDVYRLMNMPIMPPELREDRGEIEAALAGRLPTLIESGDLRGDLHTHTIWSDGKSTSEEMVEEAARLGYEYIALTDHSPSERIAHGLDRDRLEKKIEEIERLRSKRGTSQAPHSDRGRGRYPGGWQTGLSRRGTRPAGYRGRGDSFHVPANQRPDHRKTCRCGQPSLRGRSGASDKPFDRHSRAAGVRS